MEQLELLVEELRGLESQKQALENEISQRRQLIQLEMIKANVGQFKTELATISLSERKTIKYKKDKSEVAQYLLNIGLDNLVEVIPEQITPNADFEKNMKSTGVQGIENYCEVSSSVGIITKFVKE